MKKLEDIDPEELRDVMAKGWLTHDGAWFFNAASQLGIETANRLNKAAIKTMAPLEMKRTRRLFDVGEKFESIEERNEFARSALLAIMPGSVARRLDLSFPDPRTMSWEWEEESCFAYNGMQTFGLIDGYECGVIYRIECWLEALGLTFEVKPRITTCIMKDGGRCSGRFVFPA